MRCPDLLITQSCVTKVLNSIAHAVYRSTNQLCPARQLRCYRKSEDFLQHLSRLLLTPNAAGISPFDFNVSAFRRTMRDSAGRVTNSSFEFAKRAIPVGANAYLCCPKNCPFSQIVDFYPACSTKEA